MQIIDLHCHTAFSVDAYGSPEEKVRRAKELGLTAISITEHNSLASTMRAMEAAKEAGIRYIHGVELDLYWGDPLRTSHFLCYWFDLASETFREFVRHSNSVYDGQATWLLEQVGESVGINDSEYRQWLRERCGESRQSSMWRIAAFCEQAGLVPRGKSAVGQLLALAKGKPPWDFPTLEDAVPAIRAARGLLIMAHPGRVFCPGESLEPLRQLIMTDQIDGFEMYHKSNPPDMEPYRELVMEFDCAITGGTDCHDLHHPQSPFGKHPVVPEAVIATMERAYKRRYGMSPPK